MNREHWDMQLQQQDWTPQQQVMRALHSRYERGELRFEDFERALDRVIAAKTPEECWAVLQELPPLPVQALQAQEVPSQPVVQLSPTQWILSLVGEVKRIRHPWKVAEQTTVFLGAGEVELDLSMATLPQSGTLQVYMLAGEVKIYVPRSIHVTVSTTAVLGESSALGQKAEGIFAHSSSQSAAEDTPYTTAPYLDIQAHILMGEVRVVQVDEPVIITKMQKKQRKKKGQKLKYEAGYSELPLPE
jgi:hypothetical protein